MIRSRGLLFAIRTHRIRQYLHWIKTGHISAEAERISADIPRLIEQLRQRAYTVTPPCPDCGHIAHAFRCWDMRCPCNRDGIGYLDA